MFYVLNIFPRINGPIFQVKNYTIHPVKFHKINTYLPSQVLSGYTSYLSQNLHQTNWLKKCWLVISFLRLVWYNDSLTARKYNHLKLALLTKMWCFFAAGSCRNNNNLKSKYSRRAEVPTAVTSPPATSTMNADTSTTARMSLHIFFTPTKGCFPVRAAFHCRIFSTCVHARRAVARVLIGGGGGVY